MVLYRFNLILLIVTSLVLRIACDLMEPKSSLAFVIDKTKSMEPVIEKVRSNVRKIFDKVTSSAESPIENFVLVFFGDPNVSEALITKDRELFENTLQSVEPEDGGSCPEMALTGIQKAINASLPGSYVYVFTDASAEDYVIYDEVRLSAQGKQCQVVFILNGMCSHRTELSDDYIVYPKLAEATSGQVFHVKNEDDIDMILEYVEKSIDSRRINLLSKRLGASDNKTFEVEIDSTMDQLTVSITITDFGSNSSELDAIILTPESFTVDEPPLVKLGDILVKRDEFSPKGLTGKYTIQCYSNASTYVLVTARSNVSFRHGFSTKLVPSLDNTVTGPIRGTANYLFIQLFGNDVSLTSVDLLEPNYRSILKLDLRLHNEKKQLYVTELFKPPLAKFRISVIGIDDHGKHIRRYGNLVLETEAPRPPNITITGNTSVEYGGYLQLNCSVDAFPKPKIAWKRLYDGSIMSSKVGPRNNIVLELKNLNKNVSFECNAENEVGNARETVQVKVEPKLFFDIQTPKDQILDYNAEGVLHCKVNSYPPAKISWELTEDQKVLMEEGNIVTSPDNSRLTIKHMTREARGMYSCKVEYQNHIKIYRVTVDWSARKPTFREKLEYENIFFKKGEDVTLTCSLLEGKPEPEIKWFFRWSQSRKPYKELTVYNNWQSIKIPKADKMDTGAYACIARNVIGWAIRNFNVFFERHKPTTLIDTATNRISNKSIVVELCKQAVIKCIAEGTPKPDVTWIKDNKRLTMDNINYRQYSSHPSYSLVIMRAGHEHSGTYKCKAASVAGHASSPVNVIVYFLRVKSPLDDTEVTIERYNDVILPCGDYIEGIPKPTFSWEFLKFNEASSHSVRTSSSKSSETGVITMKNGNLYLQKILETQRGFYTCTARNLSEKTKKITFKVDVLFPPVLSEKHMVYKAIKGDKLLRILCNVTGNPEPTFEWIRDGTVLTGENKKSLTLHNIRESDGGKYKCAARSDRFPGDEAYGEIYVTVL